MSNKKVLAEVPTDKLPAWLNDKLFANVLKSEGNELKTRIVSVKPAVGVGENYSSGLFRVKVETSAQEVQEVGSRSCCSAQKNKLDAPIKTRSFVIKYGSESEMMKAMNVFPREVKMYSELIPKFEAEFTLVGEDARFAPKCYMAENEPTQILMFDDLGAKGYTVQERHNGLDMAHCETFYKKLAQLHAASAVYHEKHGSYDPIFRSMYSKEMAPMSKHFNDMIHPPFINAVKSTSVPSHCVDILNQHSENHLDEMIRITSPDPDGFNVMNHGDTWLNNLLFSHDDKNKPNDVLFIDYQLSYFASPAIDIFYFFITSTNNNIRANEFDTLVQVYHVELVKSLVQLGYKKKIPTLKELHIDLLDKGRFASTLLVHLMPVVLLDPREDANVGSITDPSPVGTEFRTALFSTPRYHRALEVIVPFLAKRGMLEM